MLDIYYILTMSLINVWVFSLQNYYMLKWFHDISQIILAGEIFQSQKIIFFWKVFQFKKKKYLTCMREILGYKFISISYN